MYRILFIVNAPWKAYGAWVGKFSGAKAIPTNVEIRQQNREWMLKFFFRPISNSLHYLGCLDYPAAKTVEPADGCASHKSRCGLVVCCCRIGYLMLVWTWTAFIMYKKHLANKVMCNVRKIKEYYSLFDSENWVVCNNMYNALYFRCDTYLFTNYLFFYQCIIKLY